MLLLQSTHDEFCLCYLDTDDDHSENSKEATLWKAPITKPGRKLVSSSIEGEVEDSQNLYKKPFDEQKNEGEPVETHLPCWARGDGVQQQSERSRHKMAASSTRMEWKLSSSSPSS